MTPASTLMKQFRRALLCSALALSAQPVLAAPPPATQEEVQHLFSYLEKSGCQFNRNGSWYEATAAKEHLDKKYRYLLDKNLVSNTESFIARGATQSSMSGKAYQVKCPGTAAVASADWFSAELRRYRAQGGSKPVK